MPKQEPEREESGDQFELIYIRLQNTDCDKNTQL